MRGYEIKSALAKLSTAWQWYQLFSLLIAKCKRVVVWSYLLMDHKLSNETDAGRLVGSSARWEGGEHFCETRVCGMTVEGLAIGPKDFIFRWFQVSTNLTSCRIIAAVDITLSRPTIPLARVNNSEPRAGSVTPISGRFIGHARSILRILTWNLTTHSMLAYSLFCFHPTNMTDLTIRQFKLCGHNSPDKRSERSTPNILHVHYKHGVEKSGRNWPSWAQHGSDTSCSRY